MQKMIQDFINNEIIDHTDEWEKNGTLFILASIERSRDNVRGKGNVHEMGYNFYK